MATPLLGGQVPSGTGRIWLDNIRCSGTENRLIDCNHNALGVHNCNHNEDAGVACVDSGECRKKAKLRRWEDTLTYSLILYVRISRENTLYFVLSFSSFFLVCVQSSIRLVGGANNMTGRVEICFNNQWGTICDSQWSTPDASVVCRQLGFSETGRAYFTNVTCKKRVP